MVCTGGWSALDLTSRLGLGGTTATASEAARAEQWIRTHTGTSQPDLILVVASRGGGRVDTSTATSDGTALVKRAATLPGVEVATTWWDSRLPELISDDGTTALILLQLTGDSSDAARSANRIIRELSGDQRSLTVMATGPAAAGAQTMEQVQHDAERSELLSAPAAFAVLTLALGSLLAGLLPIVVGLVAVGGTLALLHLLAPVTEISLLTVNLTTALGFGLAVDYSLFIVTRYRDARQRGRTGPEAILESARTAGHTVLFSAGAVALCACALFCFPLYFLSSMGLACVIVVTLAAAASVFVLPALLSLFGDRFSRRQRAPVLRAVTLWGKLSQAIQRHPLLWGGAALGMLAVLALPATQARFQLADDRALASTSSVHVAGEYMRRHFDEAALNPITVVLPGLDPGDSLHALTAYSARLSEVPGVAQVVSAAGVFHTGTATPGTASLPQYANSAGAWLQVVPVPSVTPTSSAAERLVMNVRAVQTPAGPHRMVGGQAALFADTKDALAHRLPMAAGFVALSMGAALFLYTRSVLVPIKAILVAALSLSAIAGIMVTVFQQGHLQWLLGPFTVVGRLEMSTPVLVLFLAFALTMDYEMFLLARIMEEYRRTGDHPGAVRHGLESTGRLITLAAAVLILAVAVLATSTLTVVKLFGFSLAAALFLDATLVRAVLVPAIMHLGGRATWWPHPSHPRTDSQSAPLPRALSGGGSDRGARARRSAS
ncbi:MMPL family transporter [Streptomyces enissocaesilis]|uniref:MMPL family transporter n=1 Tax=Streptomyces enissocaesilis TaxID=332589 RepID=UPI0031D746D6